MIYILTVIIVVLLYFIYRLQREHHRHIESLQNERQLLLDRIQAPSFDHLKQAEIRVIKANKEEPVQKHELL